MGPEPESSLGEQVPQNYGEWVDEWIAQSAATAQREMQQNGAMTEAEDAYQNSSAPQESSEMYDGPALRRGIPDPSVVETPSTQPRLPHGSFGSRALVRRTRPVPQQTLQSHEPAAPGQRNYRFINQSLTQPPTPSLRTPPDTPVELPGNGCPPWSMHATDRVWEPQVQQLLQPAYNYQQQQQQQQQLQQFPPEILNAPILPSLHAHPQQQQQIQQRPQEIVNAPVPPSPWGYYHQQPQQQQQQQQQQQSPPEFGLPDQYNQWQQPNPPGQWTEQLGPQPPPHPSMAQRRRSVQHFRLGDRTLTTVTEGMYTRLGSYIYPWWVCCPVHPGGIPGRDGNQLRYLCGCFRRASQGEE